MNQPLSNEKPHLRGMIKKDYLFFLVPMFFFLFLGAASFFLSNFLHERTKPDGSLEKFEKFVEKVKKGERQLTTDDWIYLVRKSYTIDEDFREAGANLGEMHFDMGWLSLLGLIYQIFALFHFRKRLKELSKNSRV